MEIIIFILGLAFVLLVWYSLDVRRKLTDQKFHDTVLENKIKELNKKITEFENVPQETLYADALAAIKDKLKEEEQKLQSEHTLTIDKMREKLMLDLQLAQAGMSESVELAQMAAEKQKKLAEAAQLQYEQKIKDFDAALLSLIEASKRAESEEMQHGFYMVQFTDTELVELKELTAIANKYGRIAVPLRKAVWEVYYQKKVKDMITRVVGTTKVSGIYKITNVNNNKCYIGQAVDIGSRWTTHIKRVIGVESETTNKLYPAMRNEGLENFTFEIVETTNDLKNREVYWQEFYKVKEWGYNVRGEKNSRTSVVVEDERLRLFD